MITGTTPLGLRTDDLVIPQGTTWEVRWPILKDDGTPADLGGWQVRAQVRRTRRSAAVLHEWSTTLGNAAISNATISLRVAANESSAWDWSTAAFDVEIYSLDGRVVRVTQGTLHVDPEVTR